MEKTKVKYDDSSHSIGEKRKSTEFPADNPEKKNKIEFSIKKPSVISPPIKMSIGPKKNNIPIKMSLGSAKKPVAPIKMSLSTSSKNSESKTIAKPNLKVASVFNADDDSDEEEMPAEARMKMRNIGRETATASGPNSFGKGSGGFVDRRAMLKKELEEEWNKTKAEEDNKQK